LRKAAYGAGRAISNLAAAVVIAAAPLSAQTIVALGDSLTQGYGLPEAQGFVPQLEAWLRAQGRDVRVINAGVSGDTTAGGAARVGWALADGADAMIVTLGGNDLLRGIDPAASRANLAAILKAARERGVPVLLVAMEAPGNYGPEYKAQFDAMYAELAEEYGALLARGFLAPLLDGVSSPAEIARFLQPDGIHPNAEGVQRIVAALGPRVLELLDAAGR
jgi:acyl-CoA thioesterase-1